MASFEILSCTSQSDVFPATHIKNRDTHRPWQTAKEERKASVDLLFSKPTIIKRLEIVNAGSAFIEVLVGSKDADSDHMEVLVPVTGLMTIHESRNQTNRNVSKSLDQKFIANVKEQQWQKVRLICTQPFVDSKIGLSFVGFNEKPADKNAKPAQAIEEKTDSGLDKFLKKDANKESGSDVKQDIFTQHLAKKASGTLESPPPAKKAETAPAKQSVSSAPKSPAKKNEKSSSQKSDSQKEEKSKPSSSTSLGEIMKGVIFVLSGFQNPLRGELRDKGTELGGEYKADWDGECSHLICNIPNTPKVKSVWKSGHGTIVTSDWILDCHKNKRRLPESNYLLFDDSEEGSSGKRKGSDSDTQKSPKKPKYKKEDSGSDTETMADEEIKAIKKRVIDSQDSPKASKKTESAKSYVVIKSKPAKGVPLLATQGGSDTDEMEESELKKLKLAKKASTGVIKAKPKSGGSDTDELPEATKKELETKIQKAKKPTKGGSDTDEMDQDELKKVIAKGKPSPKTKTTKNDSDTDEMAEAEVKASLKKTPSKGTPKKVSPKKKGNKIENPEEESKDATDPLPSFFQGLEILLHGNFESDQKKTLQRYVISYGGKVADKLSSKVTHVVTNDKWNDSFESMQEDNPRLLIVKPSWVIDCHDKQKVVAIQKHVVV